MNEAEAKSQKVQDMFDRIAPTYDLVNHLFSLNIDQSWRKKAISSLTQKEEMKVLDLCAGTLDLTQELLRQKPQAQVLALDFSELMLKKGESKLKPSEKKQVEIQVGDALKINQLQQKFDAVICAFGMRNIVDNAAALSQIYEVLNEGGQLVILEFFKPHSFLSKIFHSLFGARLLPCLGSLISKDKEAYSYLFSSIKNYYSLQDFCSLVSQASFKKIKFKNLIFNIASIVVAYK